MFEDNTSTIAATQNPVSHSKLKHLDTIYHQVRDFVKDDQITVTQIDSEHQLADLFTKNLNATRHRTLSTRIIKFLPTLLFLNDIARHNRT